MRDGVKLSATVYKPQDQKSPLPAIFTQTPYISDSYFDRAFYFAKNSFVFALVDVRGRGNSGGTFEPFVEDGRDGHDIVEWLAVQPWCDGNVTMWGGSHAGFNQWATAKEFPPHLRTIVPAAAAHPGVDFPAWKGTFPSYAIQWLSFTSGSTGNDLLFGSAEFWIGQFTKLYRARAPYRELDRYAGNETTVFQKWLAHPVFDDYWAAMTPNAEQYRRIDLPILTITGHYDGDQPGAMNYYRNHMKYGSPEAKEKHYLIIGPWDHPGTRTPKKEFGGLTVGEASVLDMNQLHKEWYDWTMKGGKKPEFLKKRVAYYVMGAEVWKYADSLEAIPTEGKKFFLSSRNGEVGDALHSGVLSEKPQGNSAPDRFVYDPLDVRPADVLQKEIANFITDQTSAMSLFGAGLVYHTDPMPADIEITGCPKLTAWMEMDVPDTDFYVELGEVKPNGNYMSLSADVMRARYRESLTKEKLVRPGEVNLYQFDGFFFFSRQISKNSRLRLTLQCPNTIYLEKNYNGGGVVADESAKDARTAHVAVYHDEAHPSCIEVPVAKAETSV